MEEYHKRNNQNTMVVQTTDPQDSKIYYFSFILSGLMWINPLMVHRKIN